MSNEEETSNNENEQQANTGNNPTTKLGNRLSMFEQKTAPSNPPPIQFKLKKTDPDKEKSEKVEEIVVPPAPPLNSAVLKPTKPLPKVPQPKEKPESQDVPNIKPQLADKTGETNSEASVTNKKPLPPVPPSKNIKPNNGKSSNQSENSSASSEPTQNPFVKLKPVNNAANNNLASTLNKKTSLDSTLTNTNASITNNPLINNCVNNLIVNEFNAPIGISLLANGDQRRKNEADKRSSVREIVQMLSEESKVSRLLMSFPNPTEIKSPPEKSSQRILL